VRVVAVGAADAGGVHAALGEGGPDVDLVLDRAVVVVQPLAQQRWVVVVEEGRAGGEGRW
jgi:hypothetical protein